MADPFVYVWAFRVSPERADEFAEFYGPKGAWAALFRRARGYLGTELLRDRNDTDRFLTIDRWESKGDYTRFREKFATEFEQLDRLGEQLTVEESALGQFSPSDTDQCPPM